MAPSQRGLSALADWGSVLPSVVHPLHHFVVPLPLWGRQGLLQPLPFSHRQLVAAVVFGVGGVALDPVVADIVHFHQIQEGLPEVGVQSGLFVGLDPAFFAPGNGPALLQGIEDGNQVVSVERIDKVAEEA